MEGRANGIKTIVPLCLGTPLDHISSEVQIEMWWRPCCWSSKPVKKATLEGGCRMSIVIRITVTTVAGAGHTEKKDTGWNSGGEEGENLPPWVLLTGSSLWDCPTCSLINESIKHHFLVRLKVQMEAVVPPPPHLGHGVIGEKKHRASC